MASSSTQAKRPEKYDVFLSFRGDDVRNTFVSHLYEELKRKGIHTFKDDHRLERGKSIAPELLKAIEESRFAVVVFSKNYADSSWCLDELAHIIQCREKGQVTILPVFYDVEPSDVRKQSGVFGDVLFGKHLHSEKLAVWRDALEKAANSSGWNVANEDEAKRIQVIVREIFGKLHDPYSSDDENLVGIKSRIEKVNSMLSVGSNDVRIVGIWGCGGIGKTTIARAIFDSISDQFEGRSFLHEVRDAEEKHGLVHLQKTLLSNILMEENLGITDVYAGMDKISQRLCRKRVLIVLDDVNNVDQLEKLTRERDWFGLGSRIIITTRDKHVLDLLEVDGIHKVEFLTDAEAIRVFSQKAFKKGHPKKGYKELSDCFVKYAAGLPLALKVLGSALFRKNKDVWEDALDKLVKRGPGRDILNTLKIGFEYLDDSEKDIFLDIACFFNGEEEDYVTRMLDSFGFNPKIGISVLIEKSLISRSGNKLGMHDLLQELGRDIVFQESPKEPGERSRLFRFDDIKDVLVNNTGTKKVEGILFPCTPTHETIIDSPDAFTKLNKLRFLLIRSFDGIPIRSFYGIPLCTKYLSKELRWLDWDDFPFESMSPTFQSDRLVGIKMHYNSIVRPFTEKKVLNELKYIDLSHSRKLIQTPDFTAAPNLMEIVLKRCFNLVEVHSSIGLLKRLVVIDLEGCINLQILPNSIQSKALKIFNLSWCMVLEKLPEDLGYLECLEELNLCGTAIRELPSSIGNLTRLVLIDLSHCRYLRSLPSSNLDRLPPSIVRLKNFRTLTLGRSSKTLKDLWISYLDRPKSIGSGLSDLDLSDCKLLGGSIPSDLGSLSYFKCITLDRSRVVNLPESICKLPRLEYLSLYSCKMLEALPKLPSSLTELSADECTSLKIIYTDRFTMFENLSFASFKGCMGLLDDCNIWFHRLQGLSKIVDFGFCICVPGREVLQWFNNQNIGGRISMKLPEYWYNHKLLGFAICVVVTTTYSGCKFHFKRHNDMTQLPYIQFHKHYESFVLRTVKSGHVCLAYIPLSEIFPKDEHNSPKDWCEVEVSFESEVMSCGIRLVYEDDVKPRDLCESSGGP